MSDALNALLDQIGTPAQLRELLAIEGVDDAFLEGFLQQAGAAPALDRIFGVMAERFSPERARGRSGVVQWVVRMPDGDLPYRFAYGSHGATAERGTARRPDVRLTVTAPVLIRLCAGRLNVVRALRERTLRFRGNPLVAARLPRWFDY
ncbi:hypothetical protein BTM25_51980 [Actinomadura rubteroloni]|uniref:SCP2 domain-containing protein n=1 Tax=Actinomadura rubteroloni TaxID=1926885 RepID=A0A2P4UD86_9ACTN|nr:SCP2 sterol-binding domain-containing protein [Actinomadura rubteroloni]POM22992.1 hypothetical protein BTM25_51980 [Actinomadura rubteroloni]